MAVHRHTVGGEPRELIMSQPIRLRDYEPETDTILTDVISGLTQRKKRLPAKLFYDERGSHLFDRICELPEYYPTKTEVSITRKFAPEMAEAIGPAAALIEYGSGRSEKTRLLLDHLKEPAAYIPIDISKEHLLASAKRISSAYPGLEVLPVCVDYETPFSLPVPMKRVSSRVVYFPGSTIGNFHPDEAASFLARLSSHCQPSGRLLIGVDLKKDVGILYRAYNDKQGVTAAFNVNVLLRINRELDANFNIEQFRHQAFYNDRVGRVEMHLISLEDQTVRFNGTEVCFERGESIWTESSYKYTVDEFADLASTAGFELETVWKDDDDLFSVQLYRV
jgi:dimethylhistidine N-methyltransferase